MDSQDPLACPEFAAFLAAHPGRDLNRSGILLHYLDEGQGEPVVMVHGNPTWSFFFRRLVEALSPTYRTIAPDQIGCGLSDKPEDSRYAYTLASRADDLEALLDHLGIDRNVTLVVHDWGGMIGMTYAVRHPERIARIVVMNTAAFHLPAAKPLPWALWVCRNTSVGSWLVRGLNGFAQGTALIGCTKRRMSRQVRRAYVAPYDSWEHRIAIHRFVQDIPLEPSDHSYKLVSWVQERLETLASVPMLILWGMRDFVFDRHFLEEWIQRFPNAEIHRFDQAGHYVLEEESDAIIAAIKEFFCATSISSLRAFESPPEVVF
jgi:haloalkane dehalogenase